MFKLKSNNILCLFRYKYNLFFHVLICETQKNDKRHGLFHKRFNKYCKRIVL